MHPNTTHPDSPPCASLNIIICGAGLGGLGAAIALARKGHTVTVLEAAKGLSEVGAGIQIPPNASRILKEYGLESRFLEKVVWPQDFAFRRYATGELLGATPLHPHLTDRYGHPYWLIHRADYQKLLFDAAEAQGAMIHLNSSITSVDQSVPSVTLKNGQTLIADLIVGADGIRSRTRKAVLGSKDVEPTSSSNCSYRATVPVEVMLADPKIAHLMTDINANCWIGPGHHCMAYPIRQGAMYNLVLSHPAGNATAGMWNEPGDLEEMKNHYADFDPVVKRVLSKVKSCLNWKVADLPSLPTWVSDSGKVVLIGDAAHAMTPFLAQGAAQAIEDGAVLGECLARVQSKLNIPNALRAYETIRKPRAERVQQGSRETSAVWHLKDGPDQQRRDTAFSLMRREQDVGERGDDQLVEVNPNSLSGKDFQPWLYGYDAFESSNKALNKLLCVDKQTRF